MRETKHFPRRVRGSRDVLYAGKVVVGGSSYIFSYFAIKI